MAFADTFEKLTGIGVFRRDDFEDENYDDSPIEETLESDEYEEDEYDAPPRNRSGFFANLSRFGRSRVRDTEEYAVEDEMEDEPMREREYTPRSRCSRTSSYNNYDTAAEERRGTPVQMVLIRSRGFSEVERIAENLRQHRSIIVNFEEVEKEEAQRTLDFLSGTTFAMKGSIQKVSKCTFVFAVGQVDLVGRIEETHRVEEGSFSLFNN